MSYDIQWQRNIEIMKHSLLDSSITFYFKHMNLEGSPAVRFCECQIHYFIVTPLYLNYKKKQTMICINNRLNNETFNYKQESMEKEKFEKKNVFTISY